MEKIKFSQQGSEPVEFYVLEQTRLGGISYLLVTDKEDGDAEALEVYKHFLSGGIIIIDTALVYEHRDTAGLVLDIKTLEDVARAVVACNACLEEKAVFDSDGLG